MHSGGVLFLLALALLLVLPGPWNVVGAAVAVVLGVGEVSLWQRTVRGRKAEVGAETLVGTQGTSLSPCRPEGQVQLGAEIWNARCDAGVDAGQKVRVVGRRGLTLVVERV